MRHHSLLAILTLVSACRGSAFSVEATVNSETRTVVELNWTTRSPGVSWVEYGPTADYGMSTPVSAAAATDHHVPLFGLPPLSPVYYRAVTELDDGGVLEAYGETETEGVPADLPDLVVNVWDPELGSTEPYMMGLLVGIESAIVVLDREGTVVWYRMLGSSTGPGAAYFGDVQTAVDGDGLVYNRFQTS